MCIRDRFWITLKTGIVASVFSFFIGIAFAELVINTKGRVRAFLSLIHI